MKQFTRRDLVAIRAAAGLASPALARGVTGRPAGREPAFRHGAASGDPVILWTRVTPARLNGAVAVQWRIARDRSLRNPIAAGSAITDPRRDYTVKVDAAGLEPGRTYYYGFRCEGVDSPVGRTRTLPVASAAKADACRIGLRFGIQSRANPRPRAVGAARRGRHATAPTRVSDGWPFSMTSQCFILMTDRGVTRQGAFAGLRTSADTHRPGFRTRVAAWQRRSAPPATCVILPKPPRTA